MTTIDGPRADVREMYLAHAMFRREFTLLPALVRAVPDGGAERAGVVADHLAFVQTALHHHHAAEDTHLWPKLLERGPEDIDPLVHVMESQHGAIDASITEIEAAAAAWRVGGAAERGEDVAGALDRMLPLLDEHLSLEEERVLPLIERYVSAAEWDEMVQGSAAGTPPEQVTLILGMMMYEGDPAVVEKMLSQMPADIRPVLEDAAKQAFAAHSERVHGTATPPRSVAG